MYPEPLTELQAAISQILRRVGSTHLMCNTNIRPSQAGGSVVACRQSTLPTTQHCQKNTTFHWTVVQSSERTLKSSMTEVKPTSYDGRDGWILENDVKNYASGESPCDSLPSSKDAWKRKKIFLSLCGVRKEKDCEYTMILNVSGPRTICLPVHSNSHPLAPKNNSEGMAKDTYHNPIPATDKLSWEAIVRNTAS